MQSEQGVSQMAEKRKKHEDLHTFRANDFISSLLENETDKSTFIKDALRDSYSKNLFIECPTCEGKGDIYSGESQRPNKIKAKRRRSPKTDYPTHIIRAGKDLNEKLNKESKKTEYIIQALLVAYSQQGLIDCPTCKGSGKVIGSPRVRQKALKKS